MALLQCLSILLFLLESTKSQPVFHPFNSTDTHIAIEDMRSKSYYGFAMLLNMLNGTSQPFLELTFFMPTDQELSGTVIAADDIEEFLLSHAIAMPLYYSDLSHFPTGTLVPSAIRGRVMRIHNRGRGDFFINNAQVTAPNICLSSLIKCHGIDAVIDYDS